MTKKTNFYVVNHWICLKDWIEFIWFKIIYFNDWDCSYLEITIWNFEFVLDITRTYSIKDCNCNINKTCLYHKRCKGKEPCAAGISICDNPKHNEVKK
jgi:hypothetical protein